MTTAAELHERWSRDTDYRKAYKRLGPEFEIACELIEAHAQEACPSGVSVADGDNTIDSGAKEERPGAEIEL